MLARQQSLDLRLGQHGGEKLLRYLAFSRITTNG
jgi:hypothetical protein